MSWNPWAYFIGFLTGILLGLIIILSNPSSAYANQSHCGPRESIVSYPAKKYKEHPVALGVTNNGGLVEVLQSADGSTWSILASNPQGLACLVAAGEGWKMRIAPLPDQPEKHL